MTQLPDRRDGLLKTSAREPSATPSEMMILLSSSGRSVSESLFRRNLEHVL
ncbi:hypothetical protein X773_33340 [Mesorhizobium sp. LSJC285A00]|nr:hypothetical protein X773_33340 [Mesorhizobium sp. LSJC285A00]